MMILVGVPKIIGRCPQNHNSGTFAHPDIAFEFASWISAEFNLYLVQEFERLNQIAKKQLESLKNTPSIKKIEELDDTKLLDDKD